MTETCKHFFCKASEGYKKDELVFAPMTSLSSINMCKTESSPLHAVMVGKDKFSVTAPPKPPGIKDGDEVPADLATKYLYYPYWWVAETGDEKAANMKKDVVKKGDVQFCVYKNFRAVKVGEKLMCYKHRAPKVALSNVQIDQLGKGVKRKQIPVAAD